MRSLTLVAPGHFETRTGGHLYNRRMAEGLRERGWSVDVRQLDDSFPYPTSTALQSASTVLASLGDGARLLVDGLALSAMPDAIEREAARLRIAALVHLPLGADVSVDPHEARRLAEAERRALAASGLIIATGAATVGMLAPYGIARSRIVVVEPGTACAPLSRGSDQTRVQLLTVATMNPNKGYDLLLEALAAIPFKNWHLTCAGSVTRHPATVDRVRAMIGAFDLEDRVTLVGELDAATL
ncbi:MAG: glycosyltransferase family 1 protein, partial [Acidobacteria bacterium]